MQRFMTFYWLVWLFVLFGVPEAWALISKHPENTLSDNAWRWLDVMPGQTFWQWSFLRLLVSFLLFWLWLHITFHRFT